MNYFVKVCLIAVFALGLVTQLPAEADTADAEAAKKAQQEQDQKLRKELGYISQTVELEPQQKTKMLEMVDARNAALAKWDETNKTRFRDYREQARDARKDGDREAVQQIWTDARKLMAERRAIQAEHNQQVLEVLTDAQKSTYRSSMLDRSVDRHLRDVKLTEEQTQLREELVKAGAEKISKAEPEKRWDILRSEAEAIAKKIKETLSEEQLTAAKEAGDKRRAEWQKQREERRKQWQEQRKQGQQGGKGKAPSDKATPVQPGGDAGGSVDF